MNQLRIGNKNHLKNESRDNLLLLLPLHKKTLITLNLAIMKTLTSLQRYSILIYPANIHKGNFNRNMLNRVKSHN